MDPVAARPKRGDESAGAPRRATCQDVLDAPAHPHGTSLQSGS